jgi:hypothetical protein
VPSGLIDQICDFPDLDDANKIVLPSGMKVARLSPAPGSVMRRNVPGSDTLGSSALARSMAEKILMIAADPVFISKSLRSIEAPSNLTFGCVRIVTP